MSVIEKFFAPQFNWLHAVALLIVLTLAVFLRVHDYTTWKKHPGVFQFDSEPVMIFADGYYYLRFAQDLLKGTYEPTDNLRTAPEPPPRPSPPPMLSVITAWGSQLTSLPVTWIAIVIPVLLSLTLAVSVWALGQQLSIHPAYRLIAVLFAMTSALYLDRTSIGAYDTDCLVVPFSLGASVLALGMGLASGRQRLYWLAAALLNAALFWWWWDTAPEAVLLICTLPIIGSALAYYRPQRHQLLMIIALLSCAILIWLAITGLPDLKKSADKFFEILPVKSQAQTLGFPQIKSDITELSTLGLTDIAKLSTDNIFVFFVALAGLFHLLIRMRLKACIVLSVPILLAVSILLVGLRGIIFLAPVLAIGMAGLAQAIPEWLAVAHKNMARLLVFTMAIIAAMPAIIKEMNKSPTGPRIISVLPSLQSIRDNTPQDAIIWTAWTKGYSIMYYTGRKTISDGQLMNGERWVSGNLPLATSNIRQAHRFIRFYAQHGLSGLHQIYALKGNTAEGLAWLKKLFSLDEDQALQEWLSVAREAKPGNGITDKENARRFLFPDQATPVYLLLDSEILLSHWFKHGTWDPATATGEASAISQYDNMYQQDDIIHLDDKLIFNINKSNFFSLNLKGQQLRQYVKKMATYTGNELKIRDYPYDKGFHLEWVKNAKFGALMTENIAASLFNQLFIRHTTNTRYFRPVDLHTPHYQLWEVMPHRQNSAKSH